MACAFAYISVVVEYDQAITGGQSVTIGSPMTRSHKKVSNRLVKQMVKMLGDIFPHKLHSKLKKQGVC